MSLTDDIEAFLAQGAAEGWLPSTVITYRKRLVLASRFVARRGVRRWVDATAGDLDAYLLGLLDAGRKRSSRQAIAGTLQDFFRSLQARGRLLRNPALDLPLPNDRDAALAEPPLSEEEAQRVLASLPRRRAIDLRNVLHVELLYSCGLRNDESVRANLSDVDLTNRALLVHGKGGKERVVPLMRGVLGALHDYLAVRRSLLTGPDHGALLLSATGERLLHQTIRLVLRRASKACLGGRRLHPHLLRHSIAVHLLRGGADIRYIQEFLGHESLETTKIYLRLVPGHLKDEYDEAMPTIAVGLADETTPQA